MGIENNLSKPSAEEGLHIPGYQQPSYGERVKTYHEEIKRLGSEIELDEGFLLNFKVPKGADPRMGSKISVETRERLERNLAELVKLKINNKMTLDEKEQRFFDTHKDKFKMRTN